MEDSVWDARRAELIATIRQMPPALLELRNGDELRIEVASPGHADQVLYVTHRAFMEFRGLLDPPNGSDTETAAEVVSQMQNGGAIIGYLEDRAAASLRMTVNPDHIYIGRVGVVPEQRSKGIGAAIIRYAEQIAALLCLVEIRLATREKLSDNVALYLKLGYTIDRVLPHPRGPDRVVLFVKRVEPNP